MNNFKFLQQYQQLQYKVMLDKLINLGFVRIGYCKIDKTSFWNFALVDKFLSKDELGKIQDEFGLLDRKTAIYFENRQDLKFLIEFLLKNGYEKCYEDSWMFYQDSKIEMSRFHQIKKVENESALKIFLDTFNNCYQPDDPQNPYGGLGDYLKTAEKSWYLHHDTDRLEYFIVYKSDKPVAVATLNNYEDIGYISNVGSLREVRGEGFGKLITLYCVHESQKHGHKIHCLATEKDTYPNAFYQQLGFKTLFTGVCYTQE